MTRILNSIPLKICLSILTIETLLLTIVGVYYTRSFNKEIDEAVLQKLLLPATLMSERALNFDAVRDRRVMSELLQEDVTNSFIVNANGLIHYSENSILEGESYLTLLEQNEQLSFQKDLRKQQIINFITASGQPAIAIFAPITRENQFLGAVYLRIAAQKINDKKHAIALLFFAGALVTILVTTILEFWWVYKIIVPRLLTTSNVLNRVENFDFSKRIGEYGRSDQLGNLMKQIDHMIDRIQNHTIDLQKAQKKFKDIFLSASDGIFRSSPDGKLLEANPALAQICGYSSPQEMVAQVKDLANQCYARAEERNKVVNLLLEKKQLKNYELEITKRDGKHLTISLSTHAVFDDQGTPLFFEGRISDISERKALEEAKREHQAAEAAAKAKTEMVAFLEKKNQQLEETLKELKLTQKQLIQSEKMAVLGLTAGGVAHDLNNILSALICYPELLLAQIPENSPQRPTIEAILSSGKRAAAVVADLLTLSQGPSTKREPASLNSLVEEYLGSLEFATLLKGAPHVKVHPNLSKAPLPISCSPIHVQKVIMNLIMNSVEAIRSTGDVFISTYLDENYSPPQNIGIRDDSLQRFAVLKVTDFGVGISEENLKHIFEPFYTRKVMGKKGTGLGLTIVYNIVREHQGYIEAASDNKTTTFTVAFPILASPLIPDKKEDNDNLKASGSVLVVDDEPVQRDICQNILSSLGYSVTTVPSGEKAIAYLENERVDMIILDMIMAPGINGLETYRQILEIHPEQKAIIASGFSVSEDVNEALTLGPSDFLQKPYTVKEIGRAVKKLLTS